MKEMRSLVWLALLFAVLPGTVSAVVNQKLNRELAGGKGDISGASRFVDHPFSVSPDSRFVVYIADQDQDDVFELWSVPTFGGAPLRLNGPLTLGGDVSGASSRVHHPFAISPDSLTVVYLADQETDDVFELWSVPITGGTPIRLNATLAGGLGDVRGFDDALDHPFRVTPDSRRVVYVADQETDEVFELWSVPISGGVSTKLNPALAGGEGDVHGGRGVAFRISPDGERVVYVADQETDEVFELWSVPLLGGSSIKLNPTLAGGRGDIHPDLAQAFRISPDSARVVYLADQSVDDVFELFSVPILGGRATRLNRRPVPGGQVGGASNDIGAPFRITADSRFVVFLADVLTEGVIELWSVAIAGGASVKLNPTLAGGAGDVAGVDKDLPNPFVLSPDGRRVVYIADQETDSVFELWSVAVTGGPVVKLNPTFADGLGDIRGPSAGMANPVLISPDSQRVVYIADQDIDTVFELFSVPILGGPVVKLNPSLTKSGGEVRGADNLVAHPFRITEDGRWVVYSADQEVVGVMELYRAPIIGGRVVKLNPTLNRNQGTIMGADYEVNNPFVLSADSRFVVYVADQASDELYELHTSALFGINVRAGDQDIVDDDWAPRPGDGTDFGVTAEPVGRSFTIEMLGAGSLTLGPEAVTLSGPDAAAFSVTRQPAPSLPGGGTTAFTIRFDPPSAGLRHAIVNIHHADHETPYRFAIEGTGVSPSPTGAR